MTGVPRCKRRFLPGVTAITACVRGIYGQNYKESLEHLPLAHSVACSASRVVAVACIQLLVTGTFLLPKLVGEEVPSEKRGSPLCWHLDLGGNL